MDSAPRRTALVLDGGSAQALALVRILGALGWDVVTEPHTRAARSRWTTDKVALPSPAADRAAFADEIRQVSDRLGIALVAPASDLTLTSCWQAADDADLIARARILGGGRRPTELFLDKYEGIQAARRLGFEAPRTIEAQTRDEVVAATAEIGFPAVVKPRRTVQPVRGVMRQLRHAVVRSRAEAAAAVAALTGDGEMLPLAQEFVRGRALAVTAVVRDGAVLASSARETFSFYPLAGGTSVWKRTIAPDTPGVRAALRLLCDAGVGGIAEVEYVLSAAGPRFMELGPRLHGWIPLAEASSPGLLAAAVDSSLGRDVVPLPPYRSNVQMRWLGGDLHRLGAILSPRAALPPTTSRLNEARTLWPPWSPSMLYDGVDLQDVGPWVGRTMARIFEGVGGACRRQ